MTKPHAFKTPLPKKRPGSLSRSSRASLLPVLAPLGTIACPKKPPLSAICALSVGLPRLSSTSYAFTDSIFMFFLVFDSFFYFQSKKRHVSKI
ncbi:hypothetical protein BN341_1350 [Helicobacter heilmannii ASB1.4]|nr:hypothetical protein BN341_1350 [Helicobacter heilmannii ASB1.4]